ncbi:hypothetical protein HBI56_184960 [Parastagonospora nodorum]|nr:hypothetical protein HBH53_245840 [Parastagonospora nodorum]KAH3966568.1 hypothetical protein HBH52_197500 [Parastagonospora nodorum]KAH3977811.1 hypothetical protein HBH51_070330 [Parastagonospora nodorum]KAH3994191.1 hypothetical protein HBI10_190990 [Parastagonospora nodorum]KAH4013714.1 hypothetical protein HBI13_179820 [Parastagonospora nodorum]
MQSTNTCHPISQAGDQGSLDRETAVKNLYKRIANKHTDNELSEEDEDNIDNFSSRSKKKAGQNRRKLSRNKTFSTVFGICVRHNVAASSDFCLIAPFSTYPVLCIGHR